MSFSRRDLLKAALATSGMAALSSPLWMPTLANASSVPTDKDRYFVFVYFFGGWGRAPRPRSPRSRCVQRRPVRRDRHPPGVREPGRRPGRSAAHRVGWPHLRPVHRRARPARRQDGAREGHGDGLGRAQRRPAAREHRPPAGGHHGPRVVGGDHPREPARQRGADREPRGRYPELQPDTSAVGERPRRLLDRRPLRRVVPGGQPAGGLGARRPRAVLRRGEGAHPVLVGARCPRQPGDVQASRRGGDRRPVRRRLRLRRDVGAARPVRHRLGEAPARAVPSR